MLTAYVSLSQPSEISDFSLVVDSLLFPEERTNKPGYIVTVIENDSVVYNRSTGLINVGKKIPIDATSTFGIASLSKQFTGLAIQLLIEEGKIRLTDDIHKYIPELPKYPSTVQIKHLLSHTSGIRDHLTILNWENNQLSHFYHFDGMLSELKNYCWTSFPAGENFAYSNTGYMLLALVIERVSGKSFEEYMKQVIFEPLEMSQTEFSFRRKGEEYNHSTPYAYNKNSKHFKKPKIREVNALGATGIYTTINDLVKWNSNLYHHKVGKQEVYNRMFEIDTLNDSREVYYNNGLKHRFVGDYRIIEHSGGWANYNIQFMTIPDKHTTIIVACNNGLDYPIEMAEIVLDILIPERYTIRKEEEISLEEVKLEVGYYLSTNMVLRYLDNQSGSMTISDPINPDHRKFNFAPDGSSGFFDNDFLPMHIVDSSFIWSGGTYFNTPKKYVHLPIESTIDKGQSSGKYLNCELGAIRVKYRAYNDTYVLIGSMIKRIIFKNVAPLTYFSKKKDCMIHFVDSYTFNLGNQRVFDLEFKRISK